MSECKQAANELALAAGYENSADDQSKKKRNWQDYIPCDICGSAGFPNCGGKKTTSPGAGDCGGLDVGDCGIVPDCSF